MTKKRTRKEKIHAQEAHVKSQLRYKFNKPYNFNETNTRANISDKSAYLASIKKELFRSLITASFIVILLLVIYWVS